MTTSSNGTTSALLAICAGNSPISGEFPSQRPLTRRFDVFFDLRLNKRLNEQWWGWWFETPSHPLWRHSNIRCGVIRGHNDEKVRVRLDRGQGIWDCWSSLIVYLSLQWLIVFWKLGHLVHTWVTKLQILDLMLSKGVIWSTSWILIIRQFIQEDICLDDLQLWRIVAAVGLNTLVLG